MPGFVPHALHRFIHLSCNDPMKWVLLQPSFYRCGASNTGRDFLEVTQLRNGKPGSISGSMAFVVVQLLSHVQFFVTPWTAAHQASLSFTVSWSLLKLMSIWVSDAVSGFGASQVGKLERFVKSAVTCTPFYPDPAINICLDLYHLYLHILFFDAFQSCRHQNTSPKHFSLHTSKQNSYLFPAFSFGLKLQPMGS